MNDPDYFQINRCDTLFLHKITSFTDADLTSTGGFGGASVGRWIGCDGRMLTELIASCGWNIAGAPRSVPKCCVGPGAIEIGDLQMLTIKIRIQLAWIWTNCEQF